MSEKLPKGWVKTTLGEIAEPSRERVLPTEFPIMRYVGLEHIEPQTMRLLGHGYARDVRSSSVRFSKGEVLYGKMRPYLNKVWVAEFDGLCSAEFLVFPKRDGLKSHFLAMRLNAQDFVTFANARVSGERPRVDFQRLSPFPVLLPPAVEQQRIVSKLGAALSRMANGGKAAQRALERLDRYRAAVLHAAVTGEITREWREAQRNNKKGEPETGKALLQRLLAARRARWEEAELERLRAAGKQPKGDRWKLHYPEPASPKTDDLPKLPRAWVWASTAQLGKVVTGTTPTKSRPEFFGGDIPFYKPTDLDAGFHVSSSEDSLTKAGAEHVRMIPERSILVTCIGATIGKTGFARKAGATNQQINALVPTDTSMAEFLFFAFVGPLTQDNIRASSSATTLPILNKSKFERLLIPLPPFAEQTEIVREVKHRLSAADKLQASLDQQLARVRTTRQSLLREAFAGRLIPQDPNHEPASVLLERIRAARKAEAQKPKAKRMPKSRSKKKVTHRPLLDVLREHRKPMTPEQLFRESGYEAAFNESDAPQDLVDAFYKELRKLTDKPPKVAERKDSGQQAWLRVLP